ncbi:hypothetical protein HPB47_002353 [Ixodes persulcatus]|uniref:Uncharacterized protein n=1 Tax=Ixodes persulcatus TaxID=34615 RepID=A0AC60PMX7_IXOPE|nr:hypothetical protein HPB47_002353 [Ixodes persulcatus]
MEQSKAYPLAGFAYDWDWRPLEFDRPPNPLKVCSSCCVIPREVRVLPCHHALCDTCYERAERRCPMDRETFDEGQVERLSTSLEDVADRLVWCWNRRHGCTFKGMLVDMVNHFYSKCPSHVVQCFKCYASVRRADMAMHNVKCNSDAVESEKNTSSADAALRRHFEEVRREVGGSLMHIADFMYNMESKLNSLSEYLHDDTVKNAEVRSTVVDVLRYAGRLAVTKTWRPRELSLLVSRVDYYSRIADYREEIFSVPSEVCGYSLRLGVSCQRDSGKLTLDFMVQFCKSSMDPCLGWPFSKAFTLALVNPRGSSGDILCTVNASALRRESAFEMPGDGDNPPFKLVSSVPVLDKKAYWRKGTLEIRFEIKLSDA